MNITEGLGLSQCYAKARGTWIKEGEGWEKANEVNDHSQSDLENELNNFSKYWSMEF